MKVTRWMVALTVISCIGSSARSETVKDVVKSVEIKLDKTTVKRGETVRWHLAVTVGPEWHTYPTIQPTAPDSTAKNKFEFKNSEVWKVVGSVKEPSNLTPFSDGDGASISM